MLRLARAALFAVIPAELVLAVLLLSGVALPVPLIVTAEAAVLAVLTLETATLLRLFRAARRDGADRRAALREAVRWLVPEKVRRLTGFEARGMASLYLWAARRRHGVPPGATAVGYSREERSTALLWLFAMAVETAGVDILLRGIGAPAELRYAVLVIDLYGLLIGLAVHAAAVTRPHVVSAGELRVRYAGFFDARIPRDRIAAVRAARNYNEQGVITVEDGRLAVAVASQTNIVVELTEPVAIVRPLGRRAEVTAIRFFADEPEAALQALRTVGATEPVALES
ncbi:hypothetical protein GCM10023085_60740 [Actinomadura viridis]|uniref:Uncharacterized protein n=1 Tax=Actinomadura viridis TaxID=58110 RepID=A0A931DKY0_9ACTN|nr:hypothetical protein [Actinomadura viridis]MBG6090478.1 hypothetical protein [Actinomadura viridis]